MTLLCLSEIAWGYFKTRKQFLLSRLARKGWRVVYFEPPAFGRGGGLQAREIDGVTVITIPFLKPGTSVAAYNWLASKVLGRRWIEWGAKRAFADCVRRLGVVEPVVMISNPYAVSCLDEVNASFVFYDFNDHPTQFPTAPPWAEEYLSRALARSDLVFAVSEPYREELAGRVSVPVHLLGNGVEYEHFANPERRPEPEWSRLPAPRIGYLGKLSTFLDFELLERLADKRFGSLVLAGPIPAETRSLVERLIAHEGVHYLGEIPYRQVPDLLATWHAALIPFRAGDRYTLPINPNKLYQYTAAGLPVVSSPITGWSDSQAGLYFCSEPKDFLNAVHRVLKGPIDSDRLRGIGLDHDWDRIADEMDRILKKQLLEREKVH